MPFLGKRLLLAMRISRVVAIVFAVRKASVLQTDAKEPVKINLATVAKTTVVTVTNVAASLFPS